jgi:hypothetical protein
MKTLWALLFTMVTLGWSGCKSGTSGGELDPALALINTDLHWSCPPLLGNTPLFAIEFFPGPSRTGGTGSMSVCLGGGCPPGDTPVHFDWRVGTTSSAMGLTVTTGPAPAAAPTGVTAAPTNPGFANGLITLTWGSVAGATSYTVHGAGLNRLATSPYTLHTQGGAFTLWVSAVDNYAEGPPSGAVSATVSYINNQPTPVAGVTPNLDNDTLIVSKLSMLSGIRLDDPSNPTSFTAQVTTRDGTSPLGSCSLTSGTF